jgi:WD40 repeat protein
MPRAFQGSGATSIRRLCAALGLLALVAVFASILLAPKANAAEYGHTLTVAEYGKDGPAASGLGGGCHIAYQETSDRLYLLAGGTIYGLHISPPGTATPIGGPFPLASGVFGGCGDDGIDVDNTAGASAGNIYAAQGTRIVGWTSAGTPVPGWPVETDGEVCGIGVSGTGQVVAGSYGSSGVVRYNSNGTSAGALLPFDQGQPCTVTVDTSTGDIYAKDYFGGEIQKFSAANNWKNPTFFAQGPEYNSSAQMAVNGAKDRLYVAGGWDREIRVYDTNTGALIETIRMEAPSFDFYPFGIDVDEATDTLFVADSWKNVIREIPGALLPKATTGDPIGDKKVSGTADPDGAGPIQECYFEWRLESDTTFSPTNKTPCNETMPLTTAGPVTADLPLSTNETSYRYRLVVINGERGGAHYGAEKTIIPRNVPRLTTEAATNITRNEATLNGSFEGNGESTEIWFEYGTSTSYGTKTSVQTLPAPSGPTDVDADIENLKAGTTYHYRVVGKNGQGESLGVDRTFTTAPAVKSVVTEPATDVLTETATLHGSLDPDGFETSYYFEWGKSTAYGQKQPVSPAPVGTSAPGKVELSQQLTNLEPGVIYHFRLVGVNEEGETPGNDQSFKTESGPTIVSFSATEVTETSADLVATIKPNGSDTTYYFEYGTSLQYGSVAPFPEGFIEGAKVQESVKVHIDGLVGSTYFFRLRAENDFGETVTADQTFNFNPPVACPNHSVRQQTGAAYLPDCRAYELVSPGRAGGAALFPDGPKSPYASNPARFTFLAAFNLIPGAGEAPNAGLSGDFYVASRETTGWTTKYVGNLGNETAAMGGAPGNEYGGGLNGVFTDKAMNRFVMWDRKHQTGLIGGPLAGSYAPWVFDNEGNRLDRWPTNVAEVEDGLKDMNDGGFVGSARTTPDLGHYVFSSIRTAFMPGGLELAPGSVYDNDTVNRTVTLVSLMPDNVTPIPQDPVHGTGGEYIRIPGVSDDGSHILMSTQGPAKGFTEPTLMHLYMRVDQAVSYEVSADHTGVNRAVDFQGMTPDGSTVYYTTPFKMTADDGDTSIDLYRWEESTGKAELVAVVPGKGNTDACTPTSGWIPDCGVEVVPWNTHRSIAQVFPRTAPPIDNSIAWDTDEIYFYSPEQLDGARGVLGQRNLYVSRPGADSGDPDEVEFVATIAGDRPITRINVSPDGRHLAFITATQLTAYDNGPFQEMYTVNWDREGELLCVSCIPSNVAPSSHVEGSQNGLFMSHDGRTFFATRDSLVPQDANGIRDVYEFVESRPQLISSGTGESEGNEFQPTGLIGVSADGTDVYFSTYEILVPQDENGKLLKFYDARTAGGFPFQVPALPCEAADECHGPDSSAPAPPQIGTGANLPGGNVKKSACKKKKFGKGKKKKKKARCGKARSRKKARSKQRRSRNG